jgi:hypothetical protein
MKWFFIFLLLFNVIYLGWEMDREARLKFTNAASRLEIPVTAKRLLRVSEMPSPPAARSTEDTVEVTGSIQQDEESGQFVAPEELVMDMPDMRLAVPADKAAESCFTFGPLAEMRQVQGLVDWFNSRAAWTQTRHSDKKGRQLFWIYLAPTESRESAMALLENLKDRGIRDYRLINRGSLENAVSLGLFSSQSAVNKRLSELKQKGYKPVVVPYTNADQIYWLDVKVTPDTGIIDEMYSGYPGQFKSVPVRCETIAISTSEE